MQCSFMERKSDQSRSRQCIQAGFGILLSKGTAQRYEWCLTIKIQCLFWCICPWFFPGHKNPDLHTLQKIDLTSITFAMCAVHCFNVSDFMYSIS